MKVSRAVVDTNVLISAALIAGSPPARVMHRLLEHGRLVFSNATFAELEERLWRLKFDRYLSMETRAALLHDFNAAADWIDLAAYPDIVAARYSRDASDDKFVHTALAGGVPLLISGDRDLLDLPPLAGLSILSPAAALTVVSIDR